MTQLSDLKKLSRHQSETLAAQILAVLEPTPDKAGALDPADDGTALQNPRQDVLLRTLAKLLLPHTRYPLTLDPLSPQTLPGPAENRVLQALALLARSGTQPQDGPESSTQNPGIPSDSAAKTPSASRCAAAGQNPALRAAFAADPGSAFDNSAEAGQDAEGLSEYFRRDARRYDAGFTPFP